ncbi:UdgX family uracil-DNA binding protein [Massilia sp. PWRC2]|uniref:UdgX family uracil-DNA binding protein n=1 Tax=Massilia sp. PWRC2 TaxID=2804626 RepID=UPI003CED0A84
MDGIASGLGQLADAAEAVAAGAPVRVHDFASWREAARQLLAASVAPHAVTWLMPDQDGDLLTASGDHAAPSSPSAVNVSPATPATPAMTAATADLFGNDAAAPTVLTPSAAAPRSVPAAGTGVRISRQLMDMLQKAACCRVPDRWAFLYRVVWRWRQGEQVVLSAADEDGSRLHAMVKAVRREEHDMHAYIRFRERAEADGPPRFVAWFEPAHDVLPQVAQHFVSRMGKVSWLIATPDASVLWDGAALHLSGPLLRSEAELIDAGEALWLTYYRSIFNPARLNAKLMESHIPSRFWKNLPEGQVVPAMVTQAAAGARRTGQTVSVGQRHGTTIAITAAQAQPQREAPSALAQCRRCPLWQHATQAVAGVGPGDARIMLVGEQPGDQEDLAGLPFIGPAGQLLDRVMDAAGVERRAVYLTNAVKHFKWEPRGKRRLHKTPAQREVEACSVWLEQELLTVDPLVIVALGSTALKAVLGNAHIHLKDVLGQPLAHQGRWVVAVYHPSYVLRVPDEASKQQATQVMIAGLQMAQTLTRAGRSPAS